MVHGANRPLHPPYGRLLPHRPQPFPWGLLQRYLAPVRGLFVSPLAGAAACVALLAGCSDERGPSTLPALSPSLVQSAAPSPTPSLTEEQAVEAAVRFYYEGFNRAVDARDPAELAKGSRPGCACRSALDIVERALSLGIIEGNRLTVESIRVTQVDGSTATADVQYSTAAGRVVGSDGATKAVLQSETHARRGLFLTKDTDGWLVVQVEVLGA